MPEPNHTFSGALALGVLMGAVIACNDKPPEPKPEPKPTAAPAGNGTNGPKGSPGAATKPASPHGMKAPHGDPHGAMKKPGGSPVIGWVKPEAWKEVPHASSMRMATFKIPKAEGDPEDAEMSVTQVGGGIEANIKRWEGQFEGSPAAKTEKKEVAGWEVTIVSIEGTFKSGGPMMGGGGEPKENWALLAAIVNTEPAHFFKMTGPKKTVEAARGDFDSFVASFGKK